jgi:CRP-like cAMP-binding protein
MPEESVSIPQAFGKAKVFNGLPREALEDVSRRFKMRAFERGDILFIEGEQARTYFIVGEGQVKVFQSSADGLEVILHMLGPGELVGAFPTLGEGAYPASAQAFTGLVAYSISSEAFDSLLEDYPSIAVNLLRFATQVLQASHEKLREMATERVEQRIARTLARLANQIGRQTETGILVDAPLTRQDLAEMTGTTLYTVSRSLKSWEREGILELGREKVTILDPHRLVILGEDLPPSQGLQRSLR